jgi:sugar phosphate isomerase/epimerase
MKMPRYPLLALVSSLLALPMLAAVDFHDHIGLQMWSLRDQVKADLPAALDLVKSYGITEVETAGTGNLSAVDFRKQLDARGLKAVGAHIGYEALEKDLPGSIQTAKILGAKYVVTPWIPHGKEGLTAEAAHKAAANFEKWGAAFRAEGITYGLHPHGFEFVPFASEGGKTAFDIIAAETKPENFTFEMDVFWVFHAGVDPVSLLKKYSNRWSLMHVKDIRKGAVTGLSTGGAPPIDNVAVGTGQINWPDVLKTAQDIGVKHFLIEDETPTPLVCIPDSLKYLRGLKL